MLRKDEASSPTIKSYNGEWESKQGMLVFENSMTIETKQKWKKSIQLFGIKSQKNYTYLILKLEKQEDI